MDNLATTAGLAYNGNDVVWQIIGSTAGVSAISRLPSLSDSTGLYLVNGTKVVDNTADLWDGTIDAAINMNELGVTIANDFVDTGTLSGGSPHGAHPLGHSGGDNQVQRALSNSVNSQWVDSGGGNLNTTLARFFCVSEVLTVPVPEPTSMSLLLLAGAGFCWRQWRRRTPTPTV